MSRRLVVVLFLDLVGWTRLAERVDPEPLQLLLEQYYEICSTAVEEHGGQVEKFIGDAIMAVFGAARSSEDDAPRALRTAARIRTDVAELRTPGRAAPTVEIHCGIAAGEALVTHSSRAGMRVVGDVVNLAARLQSNASAGEILVNETVAHLARAQFAMTPMARLTVKGKAEPVQAFRVIGPVETAERADDVLPMVNREPERGRLRAAYFRVARDRRSQIVAVMGPSGIGKSRLVRETLDELGPEPVVATGECPSYGPDGNHAALTQVLGTLTEQATNASNLVRANGRIAAVLTSLRHAADPRHEKAAPGPGVEEMSWALRELLAAAAAAQPLVVVWDSLQWAGFPLLRLVGDLAESLRHLPVLMICVARPELAELDVPWIRALRDRDVIAVGALAHADSMWLATSLAAASQTDEVRAHECDEIDRVAIYSAGNPLFIRLLLESAAAGRPTADRPPTITATIGAMIDRLPGDAQDLLGAASVVGPTFTEEQLALLGVPVPATGIDLLKERHLIRATGRAGEYDFTQQPVHEVAYDRLDKERRCTWHRRLAEHSASPAFHFEAAVRLLRDLRPDDADLGQLSRQATAALLREGTAALRQRDLPTAIGLLDRAIRQPPTGADPLRSVAAIRLSDALMLSGDAQRALDVVTQAASDQSCLVQRQLLAVRLGKLSDVDVETLRAELENDRDDRLSWCLFEQVRMLLHLAAGRFGAAERAARAALEHARNMGDAYEEDRLDAALCEVRQWSPTPLADKLATCAELAERFADDRFLLVPVLTARARCLALTGDSDGARAALAEASAAVEELRLTMGQILVSQAEGLVCSLDGAHAEAEQHFREAAHALERADHAPAALTMRVLAARELARRDPGGGAGDEIIELLARREQMDVRGRILCISAAVLLAARDGDADPMLGEVLSLLADIDDPCLRGDVCFDLAQTHRYLGNHTDVQVMADAAIDSYAAVGAERPERTVRGWL